MKTLVLNSYAGSLTLGAKAVGAEVIGSYEDANFGLDIQKANFPELEGKFISYIKDWPTQDLSETVVIAHPPCSAFSVQNCSPRARGVDSDAFDCTKKVLHYAAENRALAVAIESVMGALGGAWDQHQYYADHYDYHLYRILENGCMWGCQWRPRFWVLYVKKGATHPTLHLSITPNFLTVSDAVKGWEDGRSAGNQDKLLEQQKERLRVEAALTPEEMSFYFDPQDPPHPTAALGTILWEQKFKKHDSKPQEKWEVFKKYIGGFASGTMVYLDPKGVSPTLMGGSFWYLNGRCVSENAFKRIGGFPGDYIFPESPRNFRTQMRMYISKGVMPPIAAWILEQAFTHLGQRFDTNHLVDPAVLPRYELAVEPNHIADFRIRKSDWELRHEVLPPLQQHDDERPPAPKAFRPREDVLTEQQRNVFREAEAFIKLFPIHIDEIEMEELRGRVLKSIDETLNPPAPVIKVREVRPPKVKPERLTRGSITVWKATKMLGNHICVVNDATFTVGITEKKRQIIWTIIRDRGVMTLDDAIQLCLTHPELNILPTTMRWHIRQMISAKQLTETTEEVTYKYEPPPAPLDVPLPDVGPDMITGPDVITVAAM